MKYIALLPALLTLISCNSGVGEDSHSGISESGNSLHDYKVEYSGALKNIMHKSDVTAYADLNDFKDVEHLYALGAVEGLKGEILVLDGNPYISSVQDEQLAIDNSFNYKASLIVNTSISDWDEYNIDNVVFTYEELEKFISMTAEKNGIDITEPFPFLLKGTADTLIWHVINWPEGDNDHTHEKHINSGLHGTHYNTNVEILGFYSDSHHAIFTHHTTNMHLHFISSDKTKTGHVDGLTLGEGMKLLLPKIK